MIIIITGPSGSGKTTLRRILNEKYNIPTLQNVTTRDKRPGEEDGRDYLFITVEEFQRMKDKGLLLEWVKYSGNYYGLIGNAKGDMKGVTVLETEGAKRIKGMFPHKVKIVYLDVPEIIRRERMLGRGDSPEYVSERIRWDRERFEASGFKGQADLVLDNADIGQAVKEILHIVS